METVEDILEEIKPFAGESGTCNNEVALDYLNRARRILWNKVDYPTTMDYICICCGPDCFYLPSAYKQVRLAWSEGFTVSIGNEWYKSLPGVSLDADASCHKKLVEAGGFHVCYQNYEGGPYQAGIMAESVLDEGKKITVFGIDQYGTSVKEEVEVVLPPSLSLTIKQLKAVTAIIKPKTAGRIRLYAEDTFRAKRMLMGIYQPYDINPSFRKFSLGGMSCDQMMLYVKRKYVKFDELNELVEFPVEALQFAVTALVAQRSRDFGKYTESLGLAVAELNRETADNEILTASPLRFLHSDNVESLI